MRAVLRGAVFVTVLAWCSRPSSAPPAPVQAAAPAPKESWGASMAEVGRRFELVGRAALAGRTDFARYELEEIGEVFEDALPNAEPPHEGHPEVLPVMRPAFLATNLPDLRRAVDARDRAGFTAAFARTAQACNGCHTASGHAFIEIPETPGVPVPRLDPVP